MPVRPTRSPTARIDSAAMPCSSASSMAAATIRSTVSACFGPGLDSGLDSSAAGVRQRSAIDRRASP
jgi:hypothetical protein